MITTPLTAQLIRGAVALEPTERGLLPHRLPIGATDQDPTGQVALTETQPSGVRLVFRSRATVIELDTLPTKRSYPGAPPRPDGIYDLVVDGTLTGQGSVPGGNTLIIDLATGTTRLEPGRPGDPPVRRPGRHGQADRALAAVGRGHRVDHVADRRAGGAGP